MRGQGNDEERGTQEGSNSKKWTKHGKRKRREEKTKQRSLRSMIHLRKMWVLKSFPLSIIKPMKESF
jgi:hypothetical protein